MAREYYFDYNSIPGSFKNSTVEATTIGGSFLNCVINTLTEYGIKPFDYGRYNESYTGNNRYKGMIDYEYEINRNLQFKKIEVILTSENKLYVVFEQDPFISENSNDEIVEDIRKAAIKANILEQDVQVHIQQIPDEPPQQNSGCYVATAVYGSYNCPEVWTLRRFRDFQLAKSWYGRVFIKIYYTISPILVKHFGTEHWFQRFWKGKLDRLAANLKANGFDDTPYCD